MIKLLNCLLRFNAEMAGNDMRLVNVNQIKDKVKEIC